MIILYILKVQLKVFSQNNFITRRVWISTTPSKKNSKPWLAPLYHMNSPDRVYSFCKTCFEQKYIFLMLKLLYQKDIFLLKTCLTERICSVWWLHMIQQCCTSRSKELDMSQWQGLFRSTCLYWQLRWKILNLGYKVAKL